MVRFTICTVATRMGDDRWHLSISSFDKDKGGIYDYLDEEEEKVDRRQYICRDVAALGAAADAILTKVIDRYQALCDRANEKRNPYEELSDMESELAQRSERNRFRPHSGENIKWRYIPLGGGEMKFVGNRLNSILPGLKVRDTKHEEDTEVTEFATVFGPNSKSQHMAKVSVTKNADDDYLVGATIMDLFSTSDFGPDDDKEYIEIGFECDQWEGLIRAIDGPVSEMLRAFTEKVGQDTPDMGKELSLSWLPAPTELK
jgi:hypothetical protein